MIANDTRVFTDINQLHTFMGDDWSLLGTSSRSLALLACQIYAVYGYDTYLTAPKDPDGYMPTPELSFAIRDLRRSRRAERVGLAQPPGRQRLQGVHPDRRPVLPAGRLDAVQGGRAGRARPADRGAGRPAFWARPPRCPADVHRKYIEHVHQPRRGDLRGSRRPVRATVPLVYTPLCGTGLANVGETLTEAGYQVHTPRDQYPDGSFAPIPLRSPNPEIPGVTDPAVEFAASVGRRTSAVH